MPKGVYDRAASNWRPKPLATYPPELVEKVRELYNAGHTMREVAAMTGTTQKVLTRLMPRHGIERRKAVKRNQSGAANHMWRGDEAGYQAMHLRVEAARGKPSVCSRCDATDPGLIYEWANLTGHYEDVHDYARMCRSCHRQFDGVRRRQSGKPTSKK